MPTLAPSLLQILERLPPQRLSEVEDFVAFLATRETREHASASIGATLNKLDALDLPPISEAEIGAEVRAYREEKAKFKATQI